MKSVATNQHSYDWEGDERLKRPWSRTIIYEMHVRGFTAHPSSGLAEPKRGTYAGLVEKIPYLQQLGITAVELLPVFQSIHRMRLRAGRTTGVTHRCHSLPRTRHTARVSTRWAS